MAAASRSLATALSGARFASGLLQPSYTTKRDTTRHTRTSGFSTINQDVPKRILVVLGHHRGISADGQKFS